MIYSCSSQEETSIIFSTCLCTAKSVKTLDTPNILIYLTSSELLQLWTNAEFYLYESREK